MSASDATVTGEATPPRAHVPLISIRGLRTYFHSVDGLARSVDGVSFDILPSETLGDRRRVRLRQVGDGAVDHGLIPMPPGRISRGSHVSRGHDILRFEGEMRDIRGNEIAHDLSGADDVAQSVDDDRRSDRRGAPIVHQQRRRRQARKRAVEMLAASAFPIAGATRQRVSAPILRRHAPARDDRDGARVPNRRS